MAVIIGIMKTDITAAFAGTFIIILTSLAFLIATPAAALSCLSTESYLEGVVGDESVTIFIGTTKERFDEKRYTAEVVTVDEALQGYVEKETFVYHELDESWGYLCNNGPAKAGEQGLYVVLTDDLGRHNVTQRLSIDDELVATLKSDLTEAEVEGTIGESTVLDRQNQIMTTIKDLFAAIVMLLREHAYWK